MSKNQEIVDAKKYTKTEEDIISEMMQITSQSWWLHPEIAKKITDKHIDKTLEISQKSHEYLHKDWIYDRMIFLVVLFLTVAFLVFLIVFLTWKNEDLLREIISILLAWGWGFWLWYAYNKSKESE